MEIRVKTVEEFHDAHVTIEIRASRSEVVDGALSTVMPSRNLYTDEEVAKLQDAESELVTKPLLARIRELEADRQRVREDTLKAHKSLVDERNACEARVRDLERKLAESRAVVDHRDRELDKAISNLSESRKFRIQEREEARQHTTRLADKLVAIRGLLYRPGVEVYLEDHLELGRIIQQLRDIMNDRADLPESIEEDPEALSEAREQIREARGQARRMEQKLNRVRVATSGTSLDQALVEYANHEDFKIRHMARRLRRIRTIIDSPGPATTLGVEPGSQA